MLYTCVYVVTSSILLWLRNFMKAVCQTKCCCVPQPCSSTCVTSQMWSVPSMKPCHRQSVLAKISCGLIPRSSPSPASCTIHSAFTYVAFTFFQSCTGEGAREQLRRCQDSVLSWCQRSGDRAFPTSFVQ